MNKNILQVFFAPIIMAVLVVSGLMIAPDANAAPTPLLNYQARITNSLGMPIAGTFSVRFRIYNAASGGTVLWEETQTLGIFDGLVDVRLGESSPVNLDFNTGRYFLGVRIANDSELAPRRPIGAAPFALNSSLLDGKPVGDNPNNIVPLDNNSNLNLPSNLNVNNIVSSDSVETNHITLGNVNIGANGRIRFTGNDFEGYFDGTWHSLTAVTEQEPIDLSEFCRVNSSCAGYAPAVNSPVYANRQLDNLTGVAINTGLLPNANNTLNIGSSSLAWNDMFTSYLTLSETTTPTALSNFGKLYVKSSDSSLYFQDDSGVEHNLLATGSGNVIGTGLANQVTYWTGSNTIAGSNNFMWNGSALSIAGTGLFTGALSANSLTLSNPLAIASGGTGRNTLAANGVIYGNGTSQVGMTAAPTAGQVLLGNSAGVPTFATISGDMTISSSGVATVDFGDYVSGVSAGSGIAVTGSGGQASSPVVALGPLTADWNQTGAHSINLNNPSSALNVNQASLSTSSANVVTLSADTTIPSNASLLSMYSDGDMIQSQTGSVLNPLANNATNGYFFFRSTNGVPAGIPTRGGTGMPYVPLTYDIAGNNLYVYNNGWQTVGGDFANRQLSNLQNTAINTNLLPDTNDIHNLGSDALRWNSLYIGPSGGGTGVATTIHIGSSLSNEGTISFYEDDNELVIASSGAGGYRSGIGSGSTLTAGFSATPTQGVRVFRGTNSVSINNSNNIILNTSGSIALQSTTTNVSGSLVQGSGLAPAATNGFFYLNSMTGTPIGTPTSHAGTSAMTFDNDNDILYVHNGTAWVPFASGMGGDFANRELDNLQNVAINTDLLPDTDDVHNLGSSTLRWANLYVGRASDLTSDSAIFLGNSASNQSVIKYEENGGEGNDYLYIQSPHNLSMSANGGNSSLGLLDNITLSTTGAINMFSSQVNIDNASIAGNMIQGPNSLNTNATSGFPYISSMAGAPTGVPTTYNNRVPFTYDRTNDQLYFYNNGWQSVGGDFANRQLSNLQNTAINTHLIPDTNDVHDLGSNALRWNSLYIGPSDVGVGTTIHIGENTANEATFSYLSGNLHIGLQENTKITIYEGSTRFLTNVVAFGLGTSFIDNTVAAVSNPAELCYDTNTGQFGACSSDSRLKNNIDYNAISGLSIVNQLMPAKFDYIDGTTGHTGFIAQDVQQVVPNAVLQASNGFLSLKSSELLPFVVKAVQELDSSLGQTNLKVASIKTQVDKVEIAIADLSDKVAIIQSDIAGIKARLEDLEQAEPVAATATYPSETNLPIAAGDSEITIEWLPTVSGDYSVFITPSWVTGFAVQQKTPVSFRAIFSSPAPEGATIDYKIEK